MKENSLVLHLKLCNKNSEDSDGSEQQDDAKLASPLTHTKNNSTVLIANVKKWHNTYSRYDFYFPDDQTPTSTLKLQTLRLLRPNV